MKNQKNKLIGIVILSVLVVGTIGLGYYLNMSRTELVDKRKNIITLKQEATDMESLVRQYKDVEPRITEIGKAVPSTTVDIASFLQDVNSSASISGTTVGIKVNDAKKEFQSKDGQLVEAVIIVSGSYVNTTRFVHRISNLPYYFRVRSINVKPNRSGTLDTNINVLLTTNYNET